MTRPVYRLTLTPVADERRQPSEPDAPPPLRLRALLKRCWRSYRFRALKVEQQHGAEWGRVLAQQKKEQRPGDRERWRPVQPAFDAWWRWHHGAGGEVQTLLAMRWRLADQAGVELPGVTDQASLTDLGKRFGVLSDPPPGVPACLSGGRVRLGVLSLTLTEELLEQPVEDPEDNPRQPGQEG